MVLVLAHEMASSTTTVDSNGMASEASPGCRPGRGVIVAREMDGRTVLARVYAESPLRCVRPTFSQATRSSAVCIVTFGGGLVDGDDIVVDLRVERGATLVVFTQSTTKVFRGSSRQMFRAQVEGTLVFLPDPVTAFADAHYMQRIDVELGATGACILLDGFTAGRVAFGERWAMNGLDLRTTVTTADGRQRIVTDALWLNRADGSIAARMGRFDAFATLLAIGAGVGPIISAIRCEDPPPPPLDLLIVGSVLPRATELGLPNGIFRVAASTPSRALAAIRSRLGNLPDIDVVDPFASRS